MKYRSKTEAKQAALEALNSATAVREAHGNCQVAELPADQRDVFQGHMNDWTEAHGEYETYRQGEASQSVYDNAARIYAEPDAGEVTLHQPSDLQHYTMQRQGGYVNPSERYSWDNPRGIPENAEAAVAKAAQHRNAYTRFLVGGQTYLTPGETRAYMSTVSKTHEQLMAMLPPEQHALVGTVDSLGGFLVPEDSMSDFIKDLPGFTVMRGMARVRTTSSHVATFMTMAASGNDVYSSGVSGNWRSEGWVVGGNNLPTQNQPRFGRERIPVHIWAPDIIEVTQELLEDSAINLEQELRTVLLETRGLDEDSGFINGTGLGQPMGILQDVELGSITTVQSGAANAQTYAGLVNLWSALPAQYRARATWMMNSFTLGLLAQLEDSAGNPIFPTNEIPSMLFQRPMAITEFMPDGNVDDNKAIGFGDFSFYGIADRMDMRIMRLTERMAPNVGLLAIARVGGQTLKSNPFRWQNVGA